MFEKLAERLQEAFRRLGGKGKLGPAEVDRVLSDVRSALLEADVHYQVTKDLLERVRVRALGQEVSCALNPAQQVVRIVHAELVATLGEPGRLVLRGPRPRVLLLVGLQGSGKTTTVAKLGAWLMGRGEKVWLVAADPYRPAAAQQLRVLASQIGASVFAEDCSSATEACMQAVEQARSAGGTVLIVDTAGRSQLDDALMDEVEAIGRMVSPVEVLLVADAMTGQQAVNIARGFQARLPLTGLILTKIDGDARGGAAISMRAVTGVPIKFLGTGEGLKALETFEPERLASRILGMGDVLTLIEQAEEVLDHQEAARQAARLRQGEFTLEDFAAQIAQVRRMGPMARLLDLMPVGAGVASRVDVRQAERQLVRTQAILQSMTRQERRHPELMNGSRKRRVAAGSGTSVQEVNQVLRQFQQMRSLFRQVGRRGRGGLPPGTR